MGEYREGFHVAEPDEVRQCSRIQEVAHDHRHLMTEQRVESWDARAAMTEWSDGVIVHQRGQVNELATAASVVARGSGDPSTLLDRSRSVGRTILPFASSRCALTSETSGLSVATMRHISSITSAQPLLHGGLDLPECIGR
jgi:hypothetical protein